MFGRRAFPLVFCLAALGGAARAEDVFYHVRLANLHLTEGRFPLQSNDRSDWYYNWRIGQRRGAMPPRAVLDGEGEVYVGEENRNRWWAPAPLLEEGTIDVRAPAGREVTGSLYVPKADFSGMVRLRFAIAPSAAIKDGDEFYEGKENHYDELLERDLPGGAWYRHQVRLARTARGEDPGGRSGRSSSRGMGGRGMGGRGMGGRGMGGMGTSRDFNETFDLFIGGRALRENLQLDSELWETDEDDKIDEEEMVNVSSIKGITIAEIDWKPLLADARPALDPLAKCIPADQYAVFFPSLAAVAALVDEIVEHGAPLSRFALQRSEEESVQRRYERQLCLPLSEVVGLLGPDLVDSAALTSSDPYSYFFTGTDVAVLLESREPTALQTLLLSQAALGAAKENSAQPISGITGGVAWSGFLSANRRVSCYIAAMQSAVVITNSPAQLQKLVEVERGESPPAAALDEYRFFRQRYPRGEADETALVFLSDAAIRRWCGPQWRIAALRRLREAAVMSEWQARFLDDLVGGKVKERPVHTDLAFAGVMGLDEQDDYERGGPSHADRALAGVGQLRITADGVRSSTQNTLEFQTPIAELPLDRITEAESEAYSQWRDGYQLNWRWAFDPIAVRLSVSESQLATDLSVMPLIWGTNYRWMIDLVRGVEIGPADGDPHQAIFHYIWAINRKARQAGWANLAAGAVNVDPFDWLGNWVCLFVDDDAEYWKRLAEKIEQKDAKESDLGPVALDRAPLAFFIDVRDPPKLTAFMTGMRVLIEQVAPGGTVWESFDHQGEPYVRIAPSERAVGNLPPGVGRPYLYYSFSSDGLIIAWNQDVLKRAIDRVLERRRLKKDGHPLAAHGQPWLATSVGFQFDKRFVDLISLFAGDDGLQALQALSWGNLPILNEWRRRWPDRNPVDLHEEFWHTRLVCPGGGDYVWNDEWQTMESTVYGHPGQPKRGPASVALADVVGGNFGLTFEDLGLRARAVINRRPRERP